MRTPHVVGRLVAVLFVAVLLVLGLAPAAVAQALSPDAEARRAIVMEERAKTLDELFAELARTRSPADARLIEGRIWSEWMRSGSATVDLMMAWAARSAGSDSQGVALDYLDQIILMVPDYAEAWNRRATLHFLRGDYDLSIRDIEETLAREPRHFGALAGLGQILVRQDRPQLARDAFARVLAVYPANRNAQEALAQLEEVLEGEPL